MLRTPQQRFDLGVNGKGLGLTCGVVIEPRNESLVSFRMHHAFSRPAVLGLAQTLTGLLVCVALSDIDWPGGGYHQKGGSTCTRVPPVAYLNGKLARRG